MVPECQPSQVSPAPLRIEKAWYLPPSASCKYTNLKKKREIRGRIYLVYIACFSVSDRYAAPDQDSASFRRATCASA